MTKIAKIALIGAEVEISLMLLREAEKKALEIEDKMVLKYVDRIATKINKALEKSNE